MRYATKGRQNTSAQIASQMHVHHVSGNGAACAIIAASINKKKLKLSAFGPSITNYYFKTSTLDKFTPEQNQYDNYNDRC